MIRRVKIQLRKQCLIIFIERSRFAAALLSEVLRTFNFYEAGFLGKKLKVLKPNLEQSDFCFYFNTFCYNQLLLII